MVAIQPAPVEISADVSAREATGKKNSVFACLKEKIEAQHVSDRHYLATGLACFDSALSGGLAHQHVHLMASLHNDAAATGFIVALLRAQLQQRLMAAGEAGDDPAYGSAAAGADIAGGAGAMRAGGAGVH